MIGMGREAITVRMDAEKRAALDALAKEVQRDRSYLINKAVDAFLEVHRWQIAHIEQGLNQAKAGLFATDEEIDAEFAQWR